jgi:hypothetical protein
MTQEEGQNQNGLPNGTKGYGSVLMRASKNWSAPSESLSAVAMTESNDLRRELRHEEYCSGCREWKLVARMPLRVRDCRWFRRSEASRSMKPDGHAVAFTAASTSTAPSPGVEEYAAKIDGPLESQGQNKANLA